MGYALDEGVSIYEQIGGDKIKQIAQNFYNRVYSEDVENKESQFYETFGKFFEDRSKGKTIIISYDFTHLTCISSRRNIYFKSI